jgi:hypothetical protein
MSITKLYAGVVGDPLNTSGPQLAASVNNLIDTHVSHLKALPTAANAQTDTVYNVTSHYDGWAALASRPKGGRQLIYRTDLSKALHNGVTHISPESIVAWSGSQAGLSALLGWTGTGSGVFVLLDGTIITPEMAGAIGDGIANDQPAVQASANAVSLTGGNLLLSDGATYLINTPVTVKCASDLPTTLTGSDIHFAKSNPVSIVSNGMATIKAGAAMAAMVTYVFDSSDSDIAPFYSKVEGVSFDGGGFAQDCLYLNYSMHMHVERCRFWRYTGVGIHNFGYGVAQYLYNVFKGPCGIFIERGGDSLIQHNDFFPTDGGVAAVDCGYFSGNTAILNNVFTREEATGLIYAIRLSGDYASSGSQEVRHVEIVGNEFCGMTAGVFSQSFSTGSRNVYQCSIRANHVTPWPLYNTGVLADLNSSEGFIISGNWINKVGFGDATGTIALRLNNCIGMSVTDNKFQSLEQQAIRLIDCIDCKVEQNEFIDCGKLGASYLVVGISGASSGNEFKNNKFKQSSSSYAQNGIYEYTASGGGNNIGRDNTFSNITTPYFKGNATSSFWRNEMGTAKPSTGRYHAGDRVNNSTPAIAGTSGSQYVVTGWVRLTDGVNHVASTDWAEQRTLTGT